MTIQWTTKNAPNMDIRNLPAGTLVVSSDEGEPGLIVEIAHHSRNGKRASLYVVLTQEGREIWDVGNIFLPNTVD